MNKYRDRRDVKEAVENEGVDYFLRKYTLAEAMPDEELAAAFRNAETAINKFIELLDSEVETYKERKT